MHRSTPPPVPSFSSPPLWAERSRQTPFFEMDSCLFTCQSFFAAQQGGHAPFSRFFPFNSRLVFRKTFLRIDFGPSFRSNSSFGAASAPLTPAFLLGIPDAFLRPFYSPVTSLGFSVLVVICRSGPHRPLTPLCSSPHLSCAT